MKTIIKKIISALVLIIGIPSSVHAAGMYFDVSATQDNTISEAHLILETQGEEINALEGEINILDSDAEIETVSDGNSIVPIWLERPGIENNLINFSGIIPGGFNGNGLVFKIRYRNNQNIPFEIEKARIILNNENGELAKIEALPNKISGAFPTNLKTADLYPPEKFIPEITQNKDIFDGKYILIFSTTDKGSGIEKYQVLEKIPGGKANWEDAESPYFLNDQNLNSEIYVRAVDKSGNFIIAYIPPQNKPMEGKQLFWLIPMFLLLLAIGTVLIKKYVKNI